MFCPNCGKEKSPDSNFCINCGYNFGNPNIGSQPYPPPQQIFNPNQTVYPPQVLQPSYNPMFPPTQPPPPNYNAPQYSQLYYLKKNEITILLNFFLPGIGHLYIGKSVRGVALFFIEIVLPLLSFYTILGLILIILLYPLNLVIWLFIWAWALYDGNELTSNYNNFLRMYGFPPW